MEPPYREKMYGKQQNQRGIETDRMQRRRRKWQTVIYTGIAMVIVLLNVLAWNSRAFCDAYIEYVFPIWVGTYGRLTGMLPFSVGEWMIAAGVLLLLAAVLLTVLTLFLKGGRWLLWYYRRLSVKEQQPASEPGRIYGRIMYGIRSFFLFFAWVLLAVALIMTLNCFILYHASTFSGKYFGEEPGDYELEELIEVYNHVAAQCNRLSELVERDETGAIQYPGDGSTEGNAADMKDRAVEAMQALGSSYPQLNGYYPRPKALLCSDFLCQQYMQGYYFPFSMEANYNDVMYVMNKPSTMCHELAHLRGYIYEDEANFIAYLACIQSEDIYFEYSGYLSVLNYLGNDLYRAGRNMPERYGQAVEKIEPLEVLSQVREDNVFVTDEEWDRINSKAWLDTEAVDAATDTFIDTTLKVNGVSDGMVSYSRVVKLLLYYYD